VVLTYEKIRDIQRRERAVTTIQALPKNFFKDFQDYIKRKKKIGKKEDVENANIILEDLFERRERKIVNAALEYVRAGVEPENLVPREKQLFERLVDLLKSFRRGKESLFLEKKTEEKEEKEKTEKRKEEAVEEKEKPKSKQPKKKIINRDMILVKIKEDLPEFVGPDLTIYSLRKKEITNLPKKIGELLVKKGMAEEI